ncbi:hypothetical protein chiPu_0030582, partial [Chiloscyllium punctatum]|nr:hypothetical protein [Chiloscyllium punctatum]
MSPTICRPICPLAGRAIPTSPAMPVRQAAPSLSAATPSRRRRQAWHCIRTPVSRLPITS